MGVAVRTRDDGQVSRPDPLSADVLPIHDAVAVRALGAVCDLVEVRAWSPPKVGDPVVVLAAGDGRALLRGTLPKRTLGDVQTAAERLVGIVRVGETVDAGDVSMLVLPPQERPRFAATATPDQDGLADVILRAFPAAITIASIPSSDVWCTRDGGRDPEAARRMTVAHLLALLVEAGPQRSGGWSWHRDDASWLWVSAPARGASRLVVALRPGQ